MDKQAIQRPEGFRKPAYWTDDPPPVPASAAESAQVAELSPTRYGDWVLKGIAIDF